MSTFVNVLCLGVLCFSKYLIMHFKEILLLYFLDCISIVQISKQLANKTLCLLEGDNSFK